MDVMPSSPAEFQGVCYPGRNHADFPVLAEDSDGRILAPKRSGHMRVPIWVKLSVALTLTVCLTILILSFTILARQKDRLYSQTVEKGKVSLNHFAANANIPLLNDDTLRLNRLIKDAASVEGVLYALIVDQRNTIKAHIDPHKIGNVLPTFQQMENVRKDKNVTYFHYTLSSGAKVLNLSRPITFKGKALGTVHVGLSLEFIDRLVDHESLSILILSLFIILFGIAVSILLGISFSRPISKLVGATSEIGKGNLHYRLDMNRKDEFGDLASAFNYMADDLNKKEIANAKLFSERLRAEEEAKKLEEQLQQSQKMEAVGQLAGGIAHDFNNSLTLIKVCSQLALEELKEGDPVREKIQKMDEATTRSGNLARQLMTFSRRHVEYMRILDLNDILANLNPMLRRAIGENIELVDKMAEDLGKVKADPGQIEQVIVNLVVNARDAMPNGGKLVLESANVDLDQQYARTHVRVSPGHYVMLSVNDTGNGMAPEIKEHIFEPFFTTKGEGQGTGLGLFMVYGIVQKHGGHIAVDSEPGVGTTFRIYWPRADEPMEETREELLGSDLPRGEETVLVVEDDQDLRTFMAQALKQQGYKALEAANGEEGLALFDKYRQEIKLIVTDVVMPVMDGFELTDLIMPLCPQMKALYMSGYSDKPALQKRRLDPEINFLPKPFSLKDLAIKVRKVLDT